MKNELPASYLDQVVDFISKNTKGATLGQPETSTYVDPYTGASRYTGATSASSSTEQAFSDPYTGQSLCLVKKNRSQRAESLRRVRILWDSRTATFKTCRCAASQGVPLVQADQPTGCQNQSYTIRRRHQIFHSECFVVLDLGH